MTEQTLSGKNVAILATDGVQRAELIEPKKALEAAGARTTVISPKFGTIKSWEKGNWSDEIPVDLALDQAKPDDFDSLLLPGGTMNSDRLRVNKTAVSFVRRFFETGKPVAAICHGPWMLVEANVLRGRTITSWPSLETDIRNAGGDWVDREVAVDEGLVTSRKPEDIPAFNRKMIEEIGEGVHTSRRATAPSRTTGTDLEAR
jgi:protease I